MKSIKPLYVIILVIVFAAAAFYGGMQYQKNQTRASFASGANGQFARRFGQGGGGQGGPGANGMMPVRGQVVNSNSNSVTVKLNDGSSKIVNLTGQTTISKTTTGSASDLKSGQDVTAIGTTNSDGSITAQTVLVGNGNMMFRRPGGNTQGGQGGPSGQ
jgi:type II secretory pathway pseudopilin PulG